MRVFKNNLIGIVGLTLMFYSTVVNILFYTDIIPKGYVEIGFILVMLWSVVVQLLSIKSRKDRPGKGEDSSVLVKIIAAIIMISWIISCVMAKVMK